MVMKCMANSPNCISIGVIAEEVVLATAKPTTAHIVHHRLPQCSAEDALEMLHRHARMTCNALRSHFLVEMLLDEGKRSLELF